MCDSSNDVVVSTTSNSSEDLVTVAKKRQKQIKVEDILPQYFKDVLSFYVIIDNFYCFCLKKHMSPTLKILSSMYNGVYNEDKFDVSMIHAIKYLCTDHHIRICNNNQSNVPFTTTTVDWYDYELSFPSFPGVTKKIISSRNKMLLDKIVDYILVHLNDCVGKSNNCTAITITNILKDKKFPELADSITVTIDAASNSVTGNSSSNGKNCSSDCEQQYVLGYTASADEEEEMILKMPSSQLGQDIINHIRSQHFYKKQIRNMHIVPERKATYAELEMPLPRVLSECIHNKLKIKSFYSHQAKCINAIRNGKHIVVSTPTSSGKSLVYNIPILEAILSDAATVALYLFPTKALTQDQVRILNNLCTNESDNTISALSKVKAIVCDGDSNHAIRSQVKKEGNIILTNPDFIHHNFLANHKEYIRLFKSLRYIVIDEIHQYKGSFGSHFCCIIRRLVRVIRHYNGTYPQFVCCSATIANNPSKYIQELIPFSQFCLNPNESIVSIGADEDGSPQSERCLVIWNPALKGCEGVGNGHTDDDIDGNTDDNYYDNSSVPVNSSSSSSSSKTSKRKDIALRDSSIYDCALLLSSLVHHNTRTLAFTNTRKLCELVFKHSQEYLKKRHPEGDVHSRLTSYRGGYNQVDRRSIEQRLFSGIYTGATCTNALELGIDIGDLDVTIHLGFPGSQSSLFQQIGRCGRGTSVGISIFICFDSPLDQYFVKYPSLLWDKSTEVISIDRNNRHIVKSHLLCSLKELPMPSDDSSESALWGGNFNEIINYLLQIQKVTRCPKSLQYALHPYNSSNPMKEINIRQIDPVTIAIVTASDGKQIDALGYSRAFFELFEGAIYFNAGKQYQIVKFDMVALQAVAKLVHVNYQTTSKNNTEVTIIKVVNHDRIISYGNVNVVTTVTGYVKRSLYTREVFEEGSVSLPPLSYESRGVWIDLNLHIIDRLKESNINVVASVHACNHAVITVVPLVVISEPSDLKTEHFLSYSDNNHRILLYDTASGGIGISDSVYDNRIQVIQLAYNLISSCRCADGCPCCIYHSRCEYHNNDVSKAGAQMLLQLILENVTDDQYNDTTAGSNSSSSSGSGSGGGGSSSSSSGTSAGGCCGNGSVEHTHTLVQSPGKKRQTELSRMKMTYFEDDSTRKHMKIEGNWSESISNTYMDYDLYHP